MLAHLLHDDLRHHEHRAERRRQPHVDVRQRVALGVELRQHGAAQRAEARRQPTSQLLRSARACHVPTSGAIPFFSIMLSFSEAGETVP